MIHIYCKNMSIENQDDYDDFIHHNYHRLHSIPCPRCGKRNSLIFYGTHPRTFINEDGNRSSINCQRCLCKECLSTHLILPFFIIPFFLYSILEMKVASSDPSDSIIDASYLLKLHKKLPFHLFKSIDLFYAFYLFLRSAFKKKPFSYALVKIENFVA